MNFLDIKIIAVLAGGLLLSACSLPAPVVEAADPGRGREVVRRPGASSWPKRLSATTIPYEVRRGEAPTDLGTYGRCHVLRMAGKSPEPLLFFASRTSERLYEPKGHLKLNLTADDNATRFVTRDHRITLVELEAARSEPVRGTVIYLASIMGLPPQEQEFIKGLRKAGWNVAAFLPSLDLFYRDGWPDVEGEGGIPAAAENLAQRIDGHVAERAYAVESLLAYLARNQPSWLKGARVVIGASAGALALPAVVGRVGPVDAAVIIGGGANLPRIMLNSRLDIYDPVLREKKEGERADDDDDKRKRSEKGPSRPLTPDERLRLQQLAYARTRLDPGRLAPVLNRTPTLLLSARYDHIVPAETGEDLYQALGRPERWSYPVGHVFLFLGLSSQSERVASWLEANAMAPNR